MTKSSPRVFISATSADLGTCRDLIKNALLTLGCMPVEQSSFPPDAQTVREMLRARIESCDAVIHVAGHCYGAEPRTRNASEPRRSYAQLEYDMALETKTPVHVFLCGEGFPYDKHSPEDGDLQELQRKHRLNLVGGDTLYEEVASRETLDARVHALQIRVEQLAEDLRKSRSRLAWGAPLALLAVAILATGYWKVDHIPDLVEAGIERGIESDRERNREYAQEIMEQFASRVPNEPPSPQEWNGEAVYEWALEKIAGRKSISVASLRTGIDDYVAAVRASPNQEGIDQPLADFADRRFSEASEGFARAAAFARKERLAAETAQHEEDARWRVARDRERESLLGQARSLDAAGRHAETTIPFQQALDLTPRAEYPEEWLNLRAEALRQKLRGSVWSMIDDREFGDARDALLPINQELDELHTENPGIRVVEEVKAMARGYLALACKNLSRSDEARQARLDSIALWQSLAEGTEEWSTERSSLAEGHSQLGHLEMNVDRFEEALPHLEAAFDFYLDWHEASGDELAGAQAVISGLFLSYTLKEDGRQDQSRQLAKQLIDLGETLPPHLQELLTPQLGGLEELAD